MNSSVVEVSFKVHAELNFGEEIYLSGTTPSLGCNDISRAVRLVTSTTNYPWWTSTEAILLPANDGVKYRYCLFSGGKFVRWETDDGAFRTLDVSKSKGFNRSTEDKFGEMNYRFAANDPRLQVLSLSATKSDPLRTKIFSTWNPHSLSKDEVGPEDAVIMVSYFLPVILSKGPAGEWLATWDKEALLSLQINAKSLWVGLIRYNNAQIPTEEEEAVAAVLAEMSCYPVFFNQSMHYQFYDLFCKQNLWLVMHHVADVYGPLNHNDIGAKTQQNLWFNYSQVHKMFRDKVLEIYQQNYLIWIHGFHLLLLPSFLRRRIPLAKIGYYFHTPFPSSELWRTMARREDLLRGILAANQVGFHLYEYARHFLTVCHRVLGYGNDVNAQGMTTVDADGRDVVITCIHVGVDMPRVVEIFESSSFEAEVKAWKQRFTGKVVICGIDRLERLKGIPLKLLALDQFLAENPQYVGKVVFTVIGISAGERGQDYRQTQRDVRLLVERLNNTYQAPDGSPTFYFEERHEKDIRLAQRLAYFCAADVLMMTATRDGLNRYPMEFTLARRKYGEMVDRGILPREARLPGSCPPGQGLVIISEFISSARVMRGAMVINPWRVDEVKLALSHSLTMDDVERAERTRRNLEFSTRLTTSNWAKHVLRDLKSVELATNPNASYGVGFGMQFKIMNLKSGFLPLDNKEIVKAYRAARYRLILLDWGGTIVANVHKSDKLHAYALATGAASREGPSGELKSTLEALCTDMRNIVFVVSGKECHNVAESFGAFKGLGLAAEHGFYYKWPREEVSREGHSAASHPSVLSFTSSRGKWQSILKVVDDSWKEPAHLMMDIFVQRTHGTYIETKGNALIWQFSDADPEFGFLQSKELEEHLHVVLSGHPVEIIRGGGVADGYIEVRPTGASKGAFLEHAFRLMKSSGMDADFVLTIGDDNSDEPMFEKVNELAQEHPGLSAFSVTVGKKPTAAKAYLDDPTAVVELLTTLSKTTMRERKFFSAVDLTAHDSPSTSSKLASLTLNAPSLTNLAGTGTPPSTVGPTIIRSSSAGQLVGGQISEQGKKDPQCTHSPVSAGLQRLPSNPASMFEYMHGLNDNPEGEGDEGIFF